MQNIDNFEQNLKKAVELFHNSKNIIISAHTNPDGDAIGSELGLYNFAKKLGKNCKIINDSETPDNLRFLPNSEEIYTYDRFEFYQDFENADLIFILDLNDPNRLKNVKDSIVSTRATKIVIDHHMDPQQFADIYCIDTESTSTGELIYKFISEYGDEHFNKEIAEPLYTAILTDTGSFRHFRTDAEIHRIAAKLIECGADPVSIYDNVYNYNPLPVMRLLGDALSGMKLYFGGIVCVMSIPDSLLRKYSANNNDLEGFVEKTLSVRGVQIGVLISDIKQRSEIRISMRSKGNYSVQEIASRIGGGGHYHAAGARMYDVTIDEARSQLIQILAQYYKFI